MPASVRQRCNSCHGRLFRLPWYHSSSSLMGSFLRDFARVRWTRWRNSDSRSVISATRAKEIRTRSHRDRAAHVAVVSNGAAAIAAAKKSQKETVTDAALSRGRRGEGEGVMRTARG